MGPAPTYYAHPVDLDSIPDLPGAYVLELVLTQLVELVAGQLGAVTLEPARVRYYGSAHGPGGIRARVRRHLQPDGRCDHWHVDALTRLVPVSGVEVVPCGDECELVRRDLASGEWFVTVPGFGASDCVKCPAHLLESRKTRTTP